MIVEVFGFLAVAAMVTMYALEHRSSGYVLAFAVSCAAASLYAVLIRAWPFAAVEAVWAVITLHRWFRRRGASEKA
jgi:hypothetical protein